MFSEISIRGYFQILLGFILIFVSASTIRHQKRLENPKTLIDGKVLSSKLVKEMDNQGFYRQFYYKLNIEVRDDNKKKRYTINSMDEYKKGDDISIMTDASNKLKMKVFNKSKTFLLGQWLMLVIGFFIFLTPFAKMKFSETYLTALMAPLSSLVGIALIFVYLKEKKRNLEEIDSEIIAVLKWQKINVNEEGEKKHKAATALYCPVLKYEYDGLEKIRRSRLHSNDYNFYPLGKKMSIYIDKDSGEVLEERPKQSMLLMGLVLLIMGAIGIVAIYI